MIHETTWPEGTPAWVDIMVPDRAAAEAFYGPLFGWDFEVGAPESGFYTMAKKHGQVVAGLGEAVLADPTGAVFGLWQAGSHTGANLVNEPGTVIWNEAVSHDLAAARAFYDAVFGYQFEDLSGPSFEYTAMGFDESGRPVGGLGGAGTLPDDAPAHWTCYFAVDDTDAAAARAVELGGNVVVGPQDSPYGRIAVLSGPAGEMFALMSTDEPESPDLGS